MSYQAFYTSGLESIILNEGVTKLGAGALGVTKISQIILPSTINEIAGNAFYSCSNLSNIEIKGNNVNIDPVAFSNCYSIDKITLSPTCTSLSWAAEPLDSNGKTTTLLSNGKNVVFIYPKYLKNQTSYTIPNGVTSWNYRLSSYNINTITLPSSLISLDVNAFPYNVSNIIVKEGNEKFKIINDELNQKMLFEYVKGGVNLRYYLDKQNKIVTIPATINDNGVEKRIKQLSGGALVHNISLDKISIDTESIAFNSILNITEGGTMEIGPNVNYINPRFVGRRYNYNIKINSNIKYNTIQDKNNSTIALLEKNENEYNLKKVIKKVTEINIPGKINEYPITTIGEYSFYTQDKLVKIDLSNSEITTIEQEAFYNCSSLSEVKLSNKITSIGQSCFSECLNLNAIYMPTTKENNKIAGAPWGATKGDRAVKWASQ